jgi:hypothetical protein
MAGDTLLTFLCLWKLHVAWTLCPVSLLGIEPRTRSQSSHCEQFSLVVTELGEVTWRHRRVRRWQCPRSCRHLQKNMIIRDYISSKCSESSLDTTKSALCCLTWHSFALWGKYGVGTRTERCQAKLSTHILSAAPHRMCLCSLRPVHKIHAQLWQLPSLVVCLWTVLGLDVSQVWMWLFL